LSHNLSHFHPEIWSSFHLQIRPQNFITSNKHSTKVEFITWNIFVALQRAIY
jgi:hypothetical protein